MKKLYIFLYACLTALTVSSPVMASEFILTLPEDSQDWLVSSFTLFIGICGVVSKVDAHIPEDFKAKFPRWVNIIWNFFGGNYLQSKNQDSQ